jgi:hypothetical protein
MRAGRGDLDATSLKGFDILADQMAADYPHHFTNTEHEHAGDRLFDLLTAGDPHPMSPAEAYEQAFGMLEADRHQKADTEYPDVPDYPADWDEPVGDEKPKAAETGATSEDDRIAAAVEHARGFRPTAEAPAPSRQLRGGEKHLAGLHPADAEDLTDSAAVLAGSKPAALLAPDFSEQPIGRSTIRRLTAAGHAVVVGPNGIAVARDAKAAHELAHADSARRMGELLGYPKAAVDAFVEKVLATDPTNSRVAGEKKAPATETPPEEKPKEKAGAPDRVPFPVKEDSPYVPGHIRGKTGPVRDVPINKLVATQGDLNPSYMADLLAGGKPRSDDDPTVVKVGDEYHIDNGHHRAALAHARGEKSIRAQVFEYDPKTGKTAPVAGDKPKAEGGGSGHADRLKAHIAGLTGDPSEHAAADSFVADLSKLPKADLHEVIRAAGIEGAKPRDSRTDMLQRVRNRLTAAARARERNEV